MTGADICGFGGLNPTENLCARWMQVGTLYPFARSHSHESFINKEPWRFGDIMLKTSEASIKFRYMILKYYYSLFIRSRKVGLFFKPLFFEFPEDRHTLDSELVTNTQFMIGSDLMVAPAFQDGLFYEVYFPKGKWYDLRDNSQKKEGSQSLMSDFGQFAPIFLREGRSIFIQNIENVMNVYDLDNKFELIIALSPTASKSTESIFSSVGFILALNNYSNMHHVENCMGKNCISRIDTTFNAITTILKITMVKPVFVETDYKPITIKGFRIYGIPNSSKLKLKEGKFLSPKIKLKNVNDNTIEIELEGGQEVSGEKDTEIVVNFE
jgi:alpha-glucosidase/lysosomal alpha-glucosidase